MVWDCLGTSGAGRTLTARMVFHVAHTTSTDQCQRGPRSHDKSIYTPGTPPITYPQPGCTLLYTNFTSQQRQKKTLSLRQIKTHTCVHATTHHKWCTTHIFTHSTSALFKPQQPSASSAPNVYSLPHPIPALPLLPSRQD
jgi:hypothetical protein